MRRALFLTDAPTTELYTLSLHDALPISFDPLRHGFKELKAVRNANLSHRLRIAMLANGVDIMGAPGRSEEHTSELQSRQYLVCRLLLEKKKTHRPEQPLITRTDSRYCSR